MQNFRNFKPLGILLPIFLVGCEDNVQQCQTLMNDKAKQSLALSYCEKAANEGDAKSQVAFAKLLFADKHNEKAVEFLEKAANQNNGEALFMLGQIYDKGEYTNKDLEKATFYYGKACEQNEMKGCERSHSLTQQHLAKEKADALALEKAKIESAAKETARLEAEIKAEEVRLRKEQAEALKAKIGNRKFYYGLAKYQEGSLWGHINQKGEMVIPAQWAYAANFFEGLAAVKTTEGKWGFIDTKGNYVITPRFSCVVRFMEGLAAVADSGYGESCQGGKWGFVNKSGEWMLSPVLDGVTESFKNGIAKVIYNGEKVSLNKNFEIIRNPVAINKALTDYQIKDLYSNFNKTYKESGITGAQIWVNNCYSKSKNKIGCYHFDQLVSLVDMAVANQNNYPITDFFTQDKVEYRAKMYVPEFSSQSTENMRIIFAQTQKDILKNTHLLK